MKANYSVDDSFGQVYHKDNVVMVFNYHEKNQVLTIAGFDVNKYITRNLVGMWKIKKSKQ